MNTLTTVAVVHPVTSAFRFSQLALICVPVDGFVLLCFFVFFWRIVWALDLKMSKSVVVLAPLLSCLLVLITFNNPDVPEPEADKVTGRVRRQLLETEAEMELKMMVNLVTPLMAIFRTNRTLIPPDGRRMDSADMNKQLRTGRNYNPDRSSYGGYGGYGGGCGGGCGGCGGCGGGYDGCCEEDILPLLALIALAALFLYLAFINGGGGKRRRRHVLLGRADHSGQMNLTYNQDDLG